MGDDLYRVLLGIIEASLGVQELLEVIAGAVSSLIERRASVEDHCMLN